MYATVPVTDITVTVVYTLNNESTEALRDTLLINFLTKIDSIMLFVIDLVIDRVSLNCVGAAAVCRVDTVI